MAARSTTIPTTSRRIPIQGDAAIQLEVRSVHFTNDPEMEVALLLSTTSMGTNLYMSAGEARKLAASLTEVADHFEREAAKVYGVRP